MLSKYGGGRERDLEFNKEVIRLGLLEKTKLLSLLSQTPTDESRRKIIRGFIQSNLPGSAPKNFF